MPERPQDSEGVIKVEPGIPFQPFANTTSFNEVNLRNVGCFAEFEEHVLIQEIELQGIRGTIFISPLDIDEVSHMEMVTPMGKVREVISYDPNEVIEEYPVMVWTEFEIKTLEEYLQLQKTGMTINPVDRGNSWTMDCHSNYVDSLDNLKRELEEDGKEILQNYYSFEQNGRRLIALLPMNFDRLRQLEFVFAEKIAQKT